MKLSDIHIRDPFILAEGGKYYMYGTRGAWAWVKDPTPGFDVYISDDLAEWSEPAEVFRKPENFWADRDYWAPEAHKYNGRYYMFASFKSEAQCRGTQILVSDSPAGIFHVHSEKPVTPSDWECLDGTLYINKKGAPYMIFCHEWVQAGDGKMCAVRLSDDLKTAAGEPFLLFAASEPQWAVKGSKTFVTDGPFMHRLSTGELLMIWSGFSKDGYVASVAYSDNGEIDGRWKHKDELLFSKDGGHGMIFTSKTGELMFIMHSPNTSPNERPVIKRIAEKDGTLRTL
jgi:GH43 family beta-xylosidase